MPPKPLLFDHSQCSSNSVARSSSSKWLRNLWSHIKHIFETFHMPNTSCSKIIPLSPRTCGHFVAKNGSSLIVRWWLKSTCGQLSPWNFSCVAKRVEPFQSSIVRKTLCCRKKRLPLDQVILSLFARFVANKSIDMRTFARQRGYNRLDSYHITAFGSKGHLRSKYRHCSVAQARNNVARSRTYAVQTSGWMSGEHS